MKKGTNKKIIQPLSSPNKPFYMKSWSWFAGIVVLVLVLFLIFSGDKSGSTLTGNTNEEYTVSISGTYAIGYKGVITSGPNVLDIKGVLFNTTAYNVQGWPITVVLNKPGQLGTVKVEIKRGEKVLATKETSEPYGTMTVSSE